MTLWEPMSAEPESAFSPLGLYIHVPFCERKCPYCDFNTYAGFQHIHQDLVDALCAEMARWQEPLQARPITSIFLGGGTPTLLTAGQLHQIFEAVHRHFSLAPGCEITSEANPGTVDRDKFQVLRSLGVNRLSLGVQSFQPDELRFLGRIHDVADVYRAFEAARTAGFDNVNLDFMFGLPGQSLADWQQTLEEALALAPEHLSLYSLIVEPGTPLYHWVQRGEVPPPDDDQAGALYEAAMERLAAAGYVHYEISNWAKADPARPLLSHESPPWACRHNLLYWRNQEYLGVGPGTHSHLRQPGEGGVPVSRRWSNQKPVPGYIRRIRSGAEVTDFAEELTPPVSMGETMMLGLRLVREGVPFLRFQQIHAVDLRQVFSQELERLETWGLIQMDEARVRLTRQGLMVGNQVFCRFLPDEAAET
ncbi:radical SAM family heme chaperone HemW [Litorilinea aerophila]|nr:radical SAM family heme chaperone HemW [Litorilinea aerophila]MCC9076213.1 radical SAM family heme chaperone HemW [Litorilinea aerophila]